MIDGRKTSVAMCTYNGAKYVEAQLVSILTQTVPPDELIICDDVSADNTIDIIRNIAKQRTWHTDIHILSNPNNIGFVRNFDQAIRQASGELIFLSDQDDVWFKEKIEVMSSVFFGNPSVGLVHSDALVTDSFLKPFRDSLYQQRTRALHHISARQILNAPSIPGCTLAIRSSLKDCILPIPNGWVTHDHWITTIAYATSSVATVSDQLMFYRQHDESYGGHTDRFSQRASLGIHRSGVLDYESNVDKWADAMSRMLMIVTGDAALRGDHNMNEFMREVQKHYDFACMRLKCKKMPRMSRIPASTQSFLCGDYHRNGGGCLSYAKDILIS